MRLKPQILAVASTATLRQIVEDFDLFVEDKRKRQALIDTISSARRCKPDELLGYLGEIEIKQVCEAVGLESRGRKNALITMLLEAAAPTQPAAPKTPQNVQSKSFNPLPKRIPMTDKNAPQESLQLASPESSTTNVEKYEFEPIRGYPMLNWPGKRPFTSQQYYPAQLKEVHGEEVDGWRNKMFWGDNLQVMSHLLKKYRGKIDLIYIDPPFDSKADYRKKIRLQGRIIENDSNSFEEKQYGDIWNNDEYLQFMYERLVLCKELLSETGSIFLHADWHQVHYLKIMMDELFGKARLCNEIVWKRTRAAHSDATYFGKVHDTILFYRKGAESYFNQLFVEHSPEYLARFSKEMDGRK